MLARVWVLVGRSQLPCPPPLSFALHLRAPADYLLAPSLPECQADEGEGAQRRADEVLGHWKVFD
eukprot:1636297-Alexandrium_andersonii.AAC.1